MNVGAAAGTNKQMTSGRLVGTEKQGVVGWGGAGAQVQSVEQTEFPVCQLDRPQQLQYPQC